MAFSTSRLRDYSSADGWASVPTDRLRIRFVASLGAVVSWAILSRRRRVGHRHVAPWQRSPVLLNRIKRSAATKAVAAPLVLLYPIHVQQFPELSLPQTGSGFARRSTIFEQEDSSLDGDFLLREARRDVAQAFFPRGWGCHSLSKWDFHG
jgi:hypothetical protein